MKKIITLTICFALMAGSVWADCFDGRLPNASQTLARISAMCQGNKYCIEEQMRAVVVIGKVAEKIVALPDGDAQEAASAVFLLCCQETYNHLYDVPDYVATCSCVEAFFKTANQ